MAIYCPLIALKTAVSLANRRILHDWGSRGREFKSRHSDQKSRNHNGYGIFSFALKWAKIAENIELLPTYCPLFSGLDDAVVVGRQFFLGSGAVLVKQERLGQLREELRRADTVVDGHAAVV